MLCDTGRPTWRGVLRSTGQRKTLKQNTERRFLAIEQAWRETPATIEPENILTGSSFENA
jgi:hypothetical protein